MEPRGLSSAHDSVSVASNVTTSDTYNFPNPVSSQSIAASVASRLQPPPPPHPAYAPQGLFYDRPMIPSTTHAGAASYRDHHNASPIYQPNWPQPSWTKMDPEGPGGGPSISPPPFPLGLGAAISMKSRASELLASDFKKAKLDVSPPKKRGGGKGKSKAVPKEGSKRVYSCPHCQRSYDWNYNLNRHLKYECGKENAFQCARCGRKFPHKQNCVYHLKRKHKIVCDSIDQYMAEGLVIFKGGQNPGGQTVANPNPGGGMPTGPAGAGAM